MIIPIDNDREWIQWWIEDEEWEQYFDDWNQKNVPGYRRYDVPRGVFEDEL